MKWLLWKDFKLSKWWILANVMIISALGIIGVYLTYFRDFPGIILVLLSMAGVLFWSLFSGAAHYFNEDQGNARESLNTLPVQRWKILLSKALILLLENFLYWSLIVLFFYINLLKAQGLPPLTPRIFLTFYLSAILSTYTLSVISLSISSLTKDMPARWFLTILLMMAVLIALQFIPSPPFRVYFPELSSDYIKAEVDLGYTIKNLVSSFVFFVISSFWVERRGV